jgi:hypothetical protein
MSRSAGLLSHWHTMVDTFSTSAVAFYADVESRLSDREVPHLAISRVTFKEGGLLSARREYLRVARGRLTYDIGAAPFGTSYFFSSWCTEQQPSSLLVTLIVLVALPLAFILMLTKLGLLGVVLFIALLVGAALYLRNAGTPGAATIQELVASVPFVGTVYVRLFTPPTYYSVDTRLMFQESIHRAMIESIEALRTAHGLRALSDAESRPTMRDVLR